MYNEFVGNHTSKIGFLFIAFILAASSDVTQVLPCQMQNWLKNSFLGKHLIGFLICFLFIMLEGGWSLKEDKAENKEIVTDWSNGNALDSLVYGFILYFIFLLSAKMQLIPNMLLYSILFFLYCFNTQRLYWFNRKIITEKRNNELIEIIKYTIMTAIFVFLFGILNYIMRKKKQYGKKFSYFLFFLGTEKCKTLEKEEDRKIQSIFKQKRLNIKDLH